ncbi:MAG TPA: phosphatase PAP2 family protein [Candidatus Krumholzibacteria bacterium]|nr:phosphatase PAP2 family protein [Candidatus Krumholzibacteria bacterium]
MIVGLVTAGLLVLLAVVAAGAGVRAYRSERGPRPFSRTGRHYRRLCTRRSFLRLGAATVAAAALANSGVDQAVAGAYAARVHGPRVDALSAGWKGFGERFWFFVWGVFAMLDGLLVSTPLLRWGRGNFEAMIVGLPVLWTAQRVGGASRPSEERGARWRPFADDNTASGHTFMAAVPLLTLRADIRHQVGRGALWLASWGTGWSRLHDRKHFLSQVIYGHAIAAAAVEAVGTDVRDPDA